MRRIGVLTFTRSEYSSFLPVVRAITSDPDLHLHLLVSGMHLSPEFGCTVKEIEADGFVIHDRIEMLLSADTPAAIAKSIGLGTIGLAQSFARSQPDLLLIVGDRFELLAVAAAALPFGIPLAHVSGGDITEGAFDNQVRHAISKLSHLHFVSMQAHADRLIQMGEERWRIAVTGDPALDLLRQVKLLTRAELSAALGLELEPPVLLVTYHPTTLAAASAEEEIDSLLKALSQVQATMIFTYPNADTQSRVIIERIERFVASCPRAYFFKSLGQVKFYSLLAQVDLMVGNSSSGIWEAPNFHLPAVNIGERQRGRARAGNVIDVGPDAKAILDGIQQGLDPSFRASLSDLQNPYGDGHAASRIVDILKRVKLGSKLLQKRFMALPTGALEHKECR